VVGRRPSSAGRSLRPSREPPGGLGRSRLDDARSGQEDQGWAAERAGNLQMAEPMAAKTVRSPPIDGDWAPSAATILAHGPGLPWPRAGTGAGRLDNTLEPDQMQSKERF
jgi:hypothetical protein